MVGRLGGFRTGDIADCQEDRKRSDVLPEMIVVGNTVGVQCTLSRWFQYIGETKRSRCNRQRRLLCHVVDIAGNESRPGNRLRCELVFSRNLSHLHSHLCQFSYSERESRSDFSQQSGNEITLAHAVAKASTSIRRMFHAIARRAVIVSRRCRYFKNGLECSIYRHSNGHHCGNVKPVAQRTEMSLTPRPAWGQSAASDGDNEDELALVQLVQPRRISEQVSSRPYCTPHCLWACLSACTSVPKAVL